MQTDLIALKDSDVLVTPARQIVGIIRSDGELNYYLILNLFDQLYDPFFDFYINSPTQRFVKLQERYPHITEITSYLNMSCYQFQRISKRISEKS